MDRTSFAGDPRTIDAAIHNIQIVGESVAALDPTLTGKYPGIPWLDIDAMRHRLVHACFSVDVGIVWNTASMDLKRLQVIVQQMLAAVSSDQ